MRKFLRTLSLFSILFLFNVVSASAQENLDVEQLECQVMEDDTEYNASTRTTTFIDNTISISYSSSGMYVVIRTSMNTTASVVGAKDIEIQIKDGSDWVTVAVSDGGESYNTITCMLSLTYTGVIEGETYRVVCTHYGNVDGYRELYHESAGFKCVY